MPSTTEMFRLSKPRAKYLMAVNKGPDAVPLLRDGDKWDLLEIYFKPDDIARIKSDPSSTDAEHVVFETSRSRRKFAIMKSFFQACSLWRDYDVIMMADDDVEPVDCTLTDIFDLFIKTGCRVGQPALTQDSFFAHFLTVRNNNFLWRRTNHIDFMCIMMTPDAIDSYMPIMDELVSGFGFDLYWGYHEWLRGTGHAVLDCTPMRHSRPIGVSTAYDGIGDPMVECRQFVEKYKIPPYPHICLDGVYAHEPLPREVLLAMCLSGYNQQIARYEAYGQYIYTELTSRMKSSE